MILRRLPENLRSQNRGAIGIELVIVIIGVFIGMQVSNWNDERLERREVERMLVQFQPELQAFVEFFLQNADVLEAQTRNLAARIARS